MSEFTSPATTRLPASTEVEGHSFLVRPDDHLQRVAGAQACCRDGFEHAQRRERSEITVEVAAVRHRIDVRTEKDRRQCPVGSGAATEDVACGVHAGFKTGRPHQADHVPTTSDIRIRIGDPTDPVSEGPARRSSEPAECLNPLSQRRRIDTSR